MPAPIAISRTRSELDSFGAPRVGSLTVGSGPSSYRESMAVSFGKDVSDIMDYSISKFCSSIDSDATAQPSTSLSRGLETTFCRNFTCCGKALDDLHDLLQHYEECHVRFEDDEMPGMVADDDLSSASSSQPPSPRPSTASTVGDAKRCGLSDEQSAFDTNIMRSSSVSKGKKRSFGQFSNGNNTRAVHQSLRRALIDGGVGRGACRSGSSIYAANSPFSTPDSSIPGTPVPESDADSAFFGGAGATPALSNLSLRSDENTLPSCAPPNLFFPSNSGNAHGPPSKREKFSSTTAAAAAAAAAAHAMAGPSSPSLASAAAAAAAAPHGHISRPGANLVVEKPFKCMTPGCDKAYKQMNGLKYHKLHGSCNRNNVPVHQIVADSAVSPTGPLASPSIQRSVTGSPTPSSAPSSPRSSAGSLSDDRKGQQYDKVYLCQVGACGKRYRNLQGLRYHYLHSGSHGLLGQALLAANGGGPSARIDATTGRAPVNTQNMSADALASIAAQAHQQQIQQQAAAAAVAAASNAATAASQASAPPAPVVSTPSPVKATVISTPAPTLAPAPAPAL